MSSRPERRLPLVAVPPLVYLGVTLIAPALNGAAGREGFWEHAAITLAVTGLGTVAWLALVSCAGRRSRRPAQSGRPPSKPQKAMVGVAGSA